MLLDLSRAAAVGWSETLLARTVILASTETKNLPCRRDRDLRGLSEGLSSVTLFVGSIQIWIERAVKASVYG